MASTRQFPFNHEPVNTTAIDAATYTVPSGKYARVVINYYLFAVPSTNLASSGVSQDFQAEIENLGKYGEVEIWLKDGDVVSWSGTNASGNIGATAASRYTEIEFDLNGTIFKRIRDYVSGWGAYGNPPILYDIATVTGGHSASFYVEEYNSLS